MFEEQTQKENTMPEETSGPRTDAVTPGQESSFKTGKETESVGEIHTLPEKFQQGLERKGGKKNKLTIIGLIVLGILLLGVAAAFLFSKIIKKSPVETSNINGLAVSNENMNGANQNLNQNLNLNENGNLNQNMNENQNINVNANENLNGNTNANGNINLNINTPIPESLDSDRDGLTDKEESDFSTNPQKPDTDSDGYTDGLEVVTGYNPLGSGTLTSSAAVKIYTNDDFSYTILYPKAWLSQATNPQKKEEVLFTADTAEFVEVLAEDNPSSLTAEQWFLTQFPQLTSSELTKIKTWDGLDGILGLDAANVYLATDDNVFIITYNTGTKKEANFHKTFEMMYKSFALLPAESTNANVNSNQNQNTNQNTNQNSNSNLNQNQNTNQNSNSNQNQNTNHNTNSGNSNTNAD